MTLLSNYWTLASFSLILLTSPHWLTLPCGLWCVPVLIVLIASLKYRKLRCLTGSLAAILVILFQGNVLRWQADSLFLAGQDITIKADVDSFFKQISHGYDGKVVITAINGQPLSYFQQPRVQLIAPRPLMPGEVVTAQVSLKSMIGLRNEVGFDRERYAFSQRLLARAVIVKGSSWFSESSNHLRSRLFTLIRQSLAASPERSLLLALTFGYRGEIEPDLWQSLRNSGLAHLVAISGLHIGIAFSVGFMMGTLVLRLSYRALLLPWLLGCVVAGCYAWLAGFSLPTERALIMCLLNVLFSLLNLRVSLVGRILATLALVLLWDPLASLAVSFWLSFLAVTVVFTYLARQSVTDNLFIRLTKMQLWLVTCMLPVSLWFFDGITLASALYNLIFVPWFSFFVVPLTLAGLTFSAVPPDTATVLWNGVAWTLKPIIYAIDWVGELWWTLNAVWILRFGMMFVVALLWPLLSGSARLWLLMLCVMAGWLADRPQSVNRWRLDVLDVGHGLAVVIDKNRRAIVYDTGLAWENGSMADAVILPLLRKRNIRSLDGLILSHMDSDHSGGWQQIQRAWSPGWIRASQDSPVFSPCIAKQTWRWNDLDFEVLWPQRGVMRAYNSHSCVLRLSDPVSGVRVLLTGDIDALVEWMLVRHPQLLRSEIVIVPHHGSKTSSIQPFVDAVGAHYAFASLARDNRWGMPADQVVSRYQAAGTTWLDTGHNGQISLLVEQGQWRVESLRQSESWYRHILRKRVE